MSCDLAIKNVDLMRGDDGTIPVLADLSALNVASWRLMARDASGAILVDLSGAGEPPLEIPVASSETAGKPAGTYGYDLELTLADSTIQTVQRGQLSLIRDITNSDPADPVALTLAPGWPDDVSAVNPLATLNYVDDAIDGAGHATGSALDTHTSDTSNPHNVTAAQVGAATSAEVAAVQSFAIQRANHTGTQAIATVVGLQAGLDGKAPIAHDHDSRYYTEVEIDAMLAGYAPASHTHTFASLTSKPTTLGGYGITDASLYDATTQTSANGFSVTAGTRAFANGFNVAAGYYTFANGFNITTGNYSFANGTNITAANYTFASGRDINIGIYQLALRLHTSNPSLLFGDNAAGFVRAYRELQVGAFDSLNTNQPQAGMIGGWTDSTSATRKGRGTIGAYDTAFREAIRVGTNGSAALLSFFGGSPVAKQSLPAAATDAASTQALANALRTLIINYGLA